MVEHPSGLPGEPSGLPSPLHPQWDGTHSRFFLARGGLRSLRGTGKPFLGFPAGELFWRDVLQMTHAEDLPKLRALISLLVERPGGCGVAEVRIRDAEGAFRPVVASVRNVLEAPDGYGLLLADLREAPEGRGPAPEV